MTGTDDIVNAEHLFDLTGEIALVTGASSGLGARFAKLLAAHGAAVILAARRVDRLRHVEREICDKGGKAFAMALDVTDSSSLPGAFDRAEDRFGTVSCLVNNAGIVRIGKPLEFGREDWQTVIDTNLNAVWLLCQEAGRRMATAKRGGTIVNIASILGLRVTLRGAAYSVAKAGLIQMTRALAVELAQFAIRVNAIAPGYIMSEMTESYLKSENGQAMIKTIPQRRYGEASDLDGTLLLLASPQASGFMTGSTIVVDGGHMWAPV
jgi:NAD(P)-dependent dehydrogenase (short-subunit alcohol dehydrogenase family)